MSSERTLNLQVLNCMPFTEDLSLYLNNSSYLRTVSVQYTSLLT